MSEYLQSVDPLAKKRYLECLQVLGLEENDDPYLRNERFTCSMSAWPDIEYGHIFGYFIKRPEFIPNKNCLIGKVYKLIISSKVDLFKLYQRGE